MQYTIVEAWGSGSRVTGPYSEQMAFDYIWMESIAGDANGDAMEDLGIENTGLLADMAEIITAEGAWGWPGECYMVGNAFVYCDNAGSALVAVPS